MASLSIPVAQLGELETLSGLPPEDALREAASILVCLARDAVFLDAHVCPLLEEARKIEKWYVACCWEGKDGSYSLQVFVWPPKTRTQIHDHTSWGAYCCVVGSVLEERCERLDDGSRLNHAHLRKVWQLAWSAEDGISPATMSVIDSITGRRLRYDLLRKMAADASRIYRIPRNITRTTQGRGCRRT